MIHQILGTSSPTHGARWELWYSPEAARSLPWGDQSLDVLKQEVESGPPVPIPPQPYIECPRLSVDEDPWAQPEPPQEPEPMQLPNDEQMVNAMRRIHVEGYQRELQRHGGIFEAPDDNSLIFDPRSLVDGEFRVRIDDFSLSVWTGRYVRYFTTQIEDHHERAIRLVLSDIRNSDEARTKRGEQPPVTPTPQALRGPIVVNGRDFEVP